jgi:plastocyanin
MLLIAASIGGCAAPTAAPPSATRAEPSRSAIPQAVTTGAPNPFAALVEIGDHWYIPAQLTVPVGTTVTWRMVGTQEHDVWAYDGSFHSPTLGPGGTYSHTFTKLGRHRYFCVPHYGDGMYGEVIVVPRG